MMRIGLFLLTNIAIIAVASIVLGLLGVGSYIDETGLNITSLMIFCLIYGMIASFISLLLSKTIAKWTTKTKVIKTPTNQTEQWLVDEVRVMAIKSGIGMPEVGIFPMEQANAFATGWNKNKALVAVSTGMLERFDKEEIRAVMGHEIGHVANGDMVTLTLIQGVLNAFVMFFARIIAYVVDKAIFKTERGVGIGYYIVMIVAQIALGILASMVVMWFSRRREYHADYAGAELASRSGMIAALERLRAESYIPDQMPESMNAFGISAGKRSGIKALLMSHPPLEERIAALKSGTMPV
jgi:heat shock protein HtpX